MYYHFDMNGGAFSYKWINTVPLERIWDSMTTSYDYGIDDLWVVNVGDLKPLEFPISYFIDMGYDFDKWGTNNPNSTDEYTKMWIEQQFGSMLDENEVSEVADIVTGYADMNGRCKPEIIFGSTFSTTKYNEAQDELRKALELEAQAEKYKAKFAGTPLESAYFELVYHPAAATATVNRMLIYKGFNDLYADQGSMLANTYAALTNEMIEKDKSLFDDYNALEGGKWNLMMNQKNHTCYTGWEDTSGSYPTVRFVEPAENGSLTVTVPDEAAAYTNGMTAQLPAFESTELQQYPITLSTTGGAKAYSVSADKEWIKFTGETSGSFDAGTTLGVYVDFEALSSSDSGKVTVSSGDETVTVEVTANIIDTSALADKTYTASNGNIVIDAQNYAQKGSAVDAEGRTAEWVELEKYGKWGSTMKTFPTTATFVKDTGNQTSEIIDKNNAPRMEYNIYVPEDGEYNIICCFGHSNNLLPDSRLRYGVSVDGGEPITVTRDAASGGFVITTELELAAGAHTITARLLSGTGEAKSAVFTSTRKRIDLLAHDFADETEGSLYTTYTEGDGSLSSSGGRITASGFSNGYYENNGIRLDITDIIRQTEGQSLYASADVEVTWDGTARLFIETVSPDGETERIVIAESGDFSNNCVSLTGSCDPVTLEEGGRAYLCITQHSGMAYFDNIMLWYYPEAMKLFTHTFNSEKAAQAAMYEPYEDGVGTVEGGSGTVLKYDKGSASGGTAGIKLDLTEKFGVDDTMSGSVFGASSFIKPGYSWSGGNSVEMFFEITGESGTKRVPLCTADTEMFAETTELFDSETLSSLGENWLAKPLSGEAALDIADGDHVYLCITTDNNPVWYDDITVYRQPGAAEPDSDEPDPDEPEITVSGIRYREDGTPYVTVTNTGSADVDIDIFTASYDETGALAGAAVTAAKVTADGKAAEIEFDADAGDRVFVWDKQMRPLSGIMTAE